MKTDKEVIVELIDKMDELDRGRGEWIKQMNGIVKYVLELRHQDLVDIEEEVNSKSEWMNYENNGGNPFQAIKIEDLIALLKAKQKEGEE